MFSEIKIAQAEFELRNAKINSRKEVEGYTVQVPNVIDRMVMALHSVLTSQRNNERKVVVHGGVPAK